MCWRSSGLLLLFGLVPVARAGPGAEPSSLQLARPDVRQLGAHVAALGGLDRWQGGGGWGGLARASAGAARTLGTWTLNAGYGGLVQAVQGPLVWDAHRARALARHRSGLGAHAMLAGSGALGWGEASTAGSWRTSMGRALRVEGQAGMAARVAPDQAAPGLRASAELGWTPHARWQMRGRAEGTRWLSAELPDQAEAMLAARWTPWLDGALSPSAGLVVTGPGSTSALAGLLPAHTLVLRAGLTAEVHLTRSWSLLVEGAFESASGGAAYQRARALTGIAATLGRVRARSGSSVHAGRTELRLRAPRADSVAVAGTFTGWVPIPLERQGEDWVGSVDLEPGTHEYVYLVDGEPLVPPEASSTRSDGFGGENGLLVVEP